MKRILKKRLAWLLVLALSVVLLEGCGNKNTRQGSGTTDTRTAAETADIAGETQAASAEIGGEDETKAAADDKLTADGGDETTAGTGDEAKYPRQPEGSELILEAKPERVASLVFGTDEMLLGLAETSHIAGLSGLDNGCVYLAAEPSAYESIPVVSSNAEMLFALEPDFIIGSGWLDEDLKAQIADSKIPYYGYTTPKTMDEQIQIVEELGFLLGEDEKTAAVVNDMKKRTEAVKSKAAAIPEEERVTVMAYNMHESSSAKGTIFDDMVTLAGGINLSAQAGLEGTAKISKEQLVELNPQVIILVEWAADTDEEFQAFVETLKNDESLQSVDAVKNGRIYASTDNSITNVSQFAVDGLEFVAKCCYPELYR
ncbi:MAG: ABC transporter substrate-binding protein [Lachnospiraceae bacterium]|nr:ABC transporter substrate-binding protein [Lachnospiraceae bacterium]